MAPSQQQFQYNSDFPTLPPQAPLEFPPAEPRSCARITTRVFHPSRNAMTTVQNVLVRTMATVPTNRVTMDDDDDDDDDFDDFSSSSDDDSSDDSDDDEMMDTDNNNNNNNNGAAASAPLPPGQEEERAYWMQRTIREAIYGRVLFGVVLKRRRPTEDWRVTTERCAIKEMSWQHIRRERDRLAEDPIKEVSAMEFLRKWHQHNQNTNTTTQQSIATSKDEGENEDSFRAMIETNIMMPMDLLSDDRHLYSIMPFCDGGELFERLDTSEKFTEGEARYWMVQILNGLEHLQHAGICHRDMSLENLLVHQSGCLIIDMGMCLRIPLRDDSRTASLSSSMQNMNLSNGGATTAQQDDDSVFAVDGQKAPRHLMTPQGTCGKWIYMSPEIYKNKEAFDGFAVDMWAAGVILFLMLTGFPPWERACFTDDRFKYMTAGYLVQMLTEWELGLSSDAMDLLQRMLWLDPKDRLSINQVRAHPWMVNGSITPPT